METDLASLSPLLADTDARCHPYSQPLNSSFTDTDLLLFALQMASAMDHLVQRNVREGYVYMQHTCGPGNCMNWTKCLFTLCCLCVIGRAIYADKSVLGITC